MEVFEPKDSRIMIVTCDGNIVAVFVPKSADVEVEQLFTPGGIILVDELPVVIDISQESK